MEKRTDKNSYTIIFAIGMVLVVGSLLAYASSSLKDRITFNRELEKKQNILYAMGINENDENNAIFVSTQDAPKLFDENIKKQIVIQGDNIIEDDQAYLIDVQKEQTSAKAGNERRLPLFIGEKDGKKYYIAPIRGKGLWDAIWAYIAMDENMVITGAFFDHKGETAGLGANINKRFFMDDFIGEDLMHNGKFVGVKVAKGNADPLNIDKTDNAVDAIAGSTITGDGVTEMLKNELRLYVPYFKNLKNN